jgi:hypothetical protein
MRILRLLNFKLIAYTTCVVLSPFLLSDAFAQDKAPNPRVNQIIQKNIQRNINALPKMEQKIKDDIAPWVSTQKEQEGIDGIPGPEANPLDKLQGHLDQARSWNEYAVDSKVILSDETFPQCLEPRLVAEYEGSHKYVDPLNILTGLACEFNCHDHAFLGLIDPVYQFQKWKAISYYWPEHQISINKSGAQMIDPDIVRENRGPQELYRQPTAQREDSDPIRGEDVQLDMLDRMGFPRSQYKDPDYHKPGKDYQLQQDGEVRYGSSMRTNLDAQAAHKRPPFIQGWETSEACLFNALNVKTDKKKVIHNRFDQGIYAITARYPETRKTLDPKRYQYTSVQAIQLSQYKQDTPNQFRESLCASWRMASNPEVYGDLAKVGFTGVNDPAYKTYCLPNGEALSGSMTFLENTPRLQADAVRAVMSALYFGSDKQQLKQMNKEPVRPNWYTLYEKRENSSVPRYVGSGYKSVEFNPGENKSNVIFVDKMQRIYPTQPRGSGNVDGVGGESSEGMRQGIAQRGSHCFRPEDIPNWSSEGRTNVSEWPLGLTQDVRKHFGESRWAVWNRRVLCSCEIKSLPWGVGCLSLNSGDKEEAGFLGTIPLAGDMPPPFKKAIPPLRNLAEKKSPASGGGPDFKGLDIPIIDIGALGAGPSAPQMPGGQQPPPELEGPPADFDLQLICIPVDGQPKPSGQASGKPSGQPSANPSGSSENKPDFSNPDRGDLNKPQVTSQQMQDYYNSLPADQQNAFANSYSPYQQAVATQFNCFD